MCGIAGFWNVRSGRPADPAVLRAATRTLAHRGPDDEGYWWSGTVGLGMRRLSVVDPAGGTQPMAGADDRVRVVFNGEIYNHAELRRELEGSGPPFRTRSDTEALVRAYEAWGPRFVEHLRGMFAFAIWDGRSRRLVLGRDRLGIKPLYLWEGPEGVAFGSELKAVTALPWVPLRWDLEAVDDFLTFEYVPAPRTIVQGVRKVRPAHRVVFDEARPDAAREERYWGLEGGGRRATASSGTRGSSGRVATGGSAGRAATDTAPDEPAWDDRDAGASLAGAPDLAAAELRDALSVAVRERLMADVPLGAFLSGGIDSSTVVGLMAGAAEEPVRTFALGFADPSYDEREHARTVARHFGTRHLDGEVGPEVVELAGELARRFDEPFGDVSAFPTYLLSRLARREVTVALSGDGGDELFAGYDHYRAHRWAARLGWLARQRGWGLVEGLLDRVPPSSSKKGPVNLAKRFVAGLGRPADLEHARWWVFQDLADRRALYAPDMARALEGRDCFGAYRARLAEGAERGFSGLNRQLYADLTGYLADDILVKVDRMSMAVSLEARVPFLDHRVVEFAMAMPGEWKLRGSTTKWILRRAVADLLPPSILQRGKEGFSIPMKNWLRGPLEGLMRETLAPDRLGERGWFDPGEVARLVDEHVAGTANHAHRLWCLMSLEMALEGLESGRMEALGSPAAGEGSA